MKGWKIGTKISTYVENYYNKILNLNRIIKGIYIKEYENKKYNIVVNFKDDYSTKLLDENSSITTVTQILRVLLFLRIIKKENNHEKLDKSIFFNDLNLDKLENLNDYYSKIKEKIIEWIKEMEFNSFDEIEIDEYNIHKDELEFYYSILWTINGLKNKLRKEEFENFYNDFACNIQKFLDEQDWLLISKLFPKIQTIKDINEARTKKIKNFDHIINLCNFNNSIPVKADSITFGEFLLDSNNSYIIPIYQRKYRWPKENVELLLEDIFCCENGFHFIGNIILNEKRTELNENKKVEIVDGQQRITTLLIIAKALYDYCIYKELLIDEKVNDFFANENNIFSRFIHIQNSKEKERFINIFSTNSEIIEDKESIFYENYFFIFNWLNVKISISDYKNQQFWENLLNKIIFVYVDIKNGDSFKIFEKLNTFNEPLSDFELFKNFILNYYDKSENGNLSSLTDKEIDKIFEDKIKKDNFNKTHGKNNDFSKFVVNFLKANNWTIKNESLPFNDFKSFLLEWIKENDLKNFENDFVDKFLNEIKIFNNISKYKYISLTNCLYYHVSDILAILLGRDVYLPLIWKLIKIICSNPLSPKTNELEKIRDILRGVETYDIRLKICNYKGQSLSEKIRKIIEKLNDIATENINAKWIFKQLIGNNTVEKEIGSLDKMSEILENEDVENKLASKILFRIENFLYMRSWKRDNINTKFKCLYHENDNLSREHFIPVKWQQNYMEYFSKIITNKSESELKSYIDDSIDKIGNALPLSKSDNSKSNNKSIDNKIFIIESTPYAKELFLYNGFKFGNIKLEKFDKDNFTPETINKRSKAISQLVKIIYSIDEQ